ncbi:MAG: hypothetical protein CMO34_07185 [Verrucomicrobia bacterium]|nr:hypothetical protein [Verrucomicrobiota bacterium]
MNGRKKLTVKSKEKIKQLVIGLGVLSIVAGTYLLTKGGTFMETYWSIFLGIILIGSAYTLPNEKHD